MENRCACGHQELCGMLNWKNVQDENFRRLLLKNRLHCESYHGLSGCLHGRQPLKGLPPTHWHVFSLEQPALLGVTKPLTNNPISSLQTPQQSPHTLYLNDSDSVFKAGKPVTDSGVKGRPCSAHLADSKPL